jgi:hypothetical protein
LTVTVAGGLIVGALVTTWVASITLADPLAGELVSCALALGATCVTAGVNACGVTGATVVIVWPTSRGCCTELGCSESDLLFEQSGGGGLCCISIT